MVIINGGEAKGLRTRPCLHAVGPTNLAGTFPCGEGQQIWLEEDLPNLFYPLFTTKKQMGTGLGLSISYALVERYGGRITVESTVGQGAEFIVWLREDGAAAGAEPDQQVS